MLPSNRALPEETWASTRPQRPSVRNRWGFYPCGCFFISFFASLCVSTGSLALCLDWELGNASRLGAWHCASTGSLALCLD